MSDRAGVPNLYSQAADGTGTVDRLTTSANPQWPTSITPDGTRVVGFERCAQDATPAIVLFPLATSGEPTGVRSSAWFSPSRVEPFAQTLFDGVCAEFSPNGRYLAYQSS